MSRLLDELKRRKVGRVVIAYAAAAFLLLQVADIVLPPLGAPDWLMASLVVLIALGFPLAVALAWAFDITPEGVVRTEASPASRDAAAPAGPLARHRAAALVAITVVAVVSGAIYATVRYVPDPALDQDLVAVMPFRVTGDPALDYLREGMVDLFAATLTGEGGPRAADPRVVLHALRRTAGRESADLAMDSAKLVAREVGAGRVLVGSVVALPGEIQIGASLVRVSATERRIDASVRGRPDQLTALVDQLTAQLLALDAGETQQRLATLTSTSLPALRAYLAGQAFYRRSRFGEATQHFDEAVAQDSTFALAALMLNVLAGWGEASTPNQARSGRLAWQNRERLGPADRVLLEARLGADYPRPRTYAEYLGDWERALPQLGDRAEALFLYGDLLTHQGALADREDYLEASMRVFARALEIDSSFTPALTHLLDGALIKGDTAEARRLFFLLEQRDTTSAAAAYQYVARTLAFADATARRALLENVDTLSGTMLRSLQGALGFGMPIEVARRAAEVQVRRALTPEERAEALAVAYGVALNAGRPGEAARHAEAALATGDGSVMSWHAHLIFHALFWDADTTMAARAAARIPRLLADSSGSNAARMSARCAAGLWHATRRNVQPAQNAAGALLEAARVPYSVDALCAWTIRAVIAQESASTDAAALLARADSIASLGPPGNSHARRALNFTLARLFEMRGAPDLARRAVRRHTYDGNYLQYYTTLLREDGRLSEQLGDRAAAIQAYRSYLALRGDVEPAIAQQVADVTAALARLTGEGQ